MQINPQNNSKQGGPNLYRIFWTYAKHCGYLILKYLYMYVHKKKKKKPKIYLFWNLVELIGRFWISRKVMTIW